MRKSYTLVEILLVVSIIAVLLAAFFFIFNPLAQIGKGWDGKRKNDLSTLKKVLEDWYNDKECYPRPEEICYDEAIDNECHICGDESSSPDFNPYLTRLPCDPQQPTKKYLYVVDDEDCPTYYRAYTNLSYTKDPVIAVLNLAYDCRYNYGVSSPNTGVDCYRPTPTPSPTPVVTAVPTITLAPTGPVGGLCSSYRDLYVILGANICNICGNYSDCKHAFPTKTYYTDPGGAGVPGCTTRCIKD